MERFIRVAIVFAITSLVGLLAILIANGDLTWGTVAMIVFVALVFGLIAGTWAVVHGHFDRGVEVGLTIGIVSMVVIACCIMLYAGHEVKQALASVFGNGAAWWLIAPVAGTVAITVVFGLHREVQRR